MIKRVTSKKALPVAAVLAALTLAGCTPPPGFGPDEADETPAVSTEDDTAVGDTQNASDEVEPEGDTEDEPEDEEEPARVIPVWASIGHAACVPSGGPVVGLGDRPDDDLPISSAARWEPLGQDITSHGVTHVQSLRAGTVPLSLDRQGVLTNPGLLDVVSIPQPTVDLGDILLPIGRHVVQEPASFTAGGVEIEEVQFSGLEPGSDFVADDGQIVWTNPGRACDSASSRMTVWSRVVLVDGTATEWQEVDLFFR